MMEHLIYSRHKRLLSAMLIGAAGFYGLTNSIPVRAEIDPTTQPIYSGPANSENYCMADAYIAKGGPGLKNTIGESLNCTANDVEITEVIPSAIILPDDTEETDLTCTLGETFKLKADIRVRANAAERWDTTFYVPRKEDADPEIILNQEDACSIIIPIPEGSPGYTGNLVAQQLDSDFCGDIRKAELTADEYTLEDAVFEFVCKDGGSDGETFDGMADFYYCAAWDNQERNNCSFGGDYPGQAPNNKSKCNCNNFNIPVFIKPNTPTVVKTEAASAKEPQGIFKYTVTITKADGADVIINNIYDIYNSTDASVNNVVFELTNSGTPEIGNLKLLNEKLSETLDYTNYCSTLTLEERTLTNAKPSVSCTFYVQITDEDLPDEQDGDLTVNTGQEGDLKEIYTDFIRFSATDTQNQGTEIGKPNCTPNTEGCSNPISVSIYNDDPDVSITKTPVIVQPNDVGLRKVVLNDTDKWFVDEDGDITYEITVTNNSTVDDVSLYSLFDNQVGSLLTDSTGGAMSCDKANNTPLAKLGGSFTCRYVDTVTFNVKTKDPLTGEPLTYDAHDNIVDVIGVDNELRISNASATAKVTRAVPMLVLDKDVAVPTSEDYELPAINDTDGFKQEVTIDEVVAPGSPVIYRFTFTNANDLTEEDLDITSLIDDILFDSPRATKSDIQRSDECIFPHEGLEYGGDPYVCTIVANVTGEGADDSNTVEIENQLLNTAYATATTETTGKEIESNEDTALVNFKNVLPQLESNFGFHANVFVKMTNTGKESIKLYKMFVRGVEIPTNGSGDVVVEIPDPNVEGATIQLFKMFDDSAVAIGDTLLTEPFGVNIDSAYPYCKAGTNQDDEPNGVVIGVDETYICFIRVELFNAFGVLKAFNADDNSQGGVTVQVIDDDDTISEGKVNVKVEALNVN